MSDRSFDMRRNGVGILLFGVGVFFAVLLVKAFTSEVPVAEAGGTAALAALWIDSLGGIAGFVFCGGIAILGARMFLDAASGNALRHAGGLAGIAVGISILAGSVSANAGGALGRAIGGGISGVAHVAVGALVGIGVIAFAVWAVWLQGARVARTHLDREIEDDGVTAAEAAALIPTETNRTLADSRKTERASTWTAPASPYPEDVRRRGEIPAGAKPLDPTQHAHTSSPSGQSGTQTSSVYRWTAARTDEPADSAGEDLARAIATAPSVEPIEEGDLDLDAPEPFAQALTVEERIDEERVENELIDDELADETLAAELEEDLLEVKALDAEVLEDEPLDRIEEIPAPQAERLPEVPRPSWEQSSLFEEADEPVDAYGTPLALVDEVVGARAEVVEGSDEDEEEDSDADDDDDDESDEYESDDDDAEDDEEDEEDEEDDEEEEDADEEVAAEAFDEDDEAEAEEAEEELEEAVAEQAESPREPALAKSAPAPAADVRLKDVVLTPQVAASPRTPSAPALPADRQKLLVDAGCLFVDNGRVAVSMLQRQYAMDFDDACKVLDELQEMGLIGPYLGGQRRDILLTRDQWLERVASS